MIFQLLRWCNSGEGSTQGGKVKIQIIILAAVLAAGTASAQVYSEDFSSLSLTNTSPASFPDVFPVTSSSSGGTLVKGGWAGINNGELVFARPDTYIGGLDACAMVLDGALFTDGAGLYTLKFDFVFAEFGANRLYLELQDVDFNGGHIEVPTVSWAKNYGTNLQAISTFDGASASVITNKIYYGGEQGQTHTIDFEYDGSGDILFRLGAGRENSSEWWTVRVDNLLIQAPPPPPDPTGLTVVGGDRKAILEWAPSTEPDVTYKVYRSVTPGVYGAPIADGLSASRYYDVALTNSMLYYYTVRAVSGYGKESGLGSEVSVVPQPYVSYSSKKGVGSGTTSKVHALNASWYYNWSIRTNEYVDAGIEYVPMRHNYWWAPLSDLANIGEFDYFLAYNEPDSADQANMTVAQAISQWPAITSAVFLNGNPGAQIGSPATVNPYAAWITDFMGQAESEGHQVDFMTMHSYPPPDNPATILGGAAWYHNTFNRDVWITEFNAADWNFPNDYTHGQCYSWMLEVLFRMESAPYIARYAVFPWDATDGHQANASHVFEVNVNAGVTNRSPVLTPLGKLYAEYRSIDISGPHADTWYYLHNRGSHQRLYYNAGSAVTADVYTEGKNANFRLVDAGNGNHYIVKRGFSGKRLGYNGSSLFWAGPSVSDSSVQWNIADEVNGWDFISHPGTGKRLSGNPLSMVSGTTTNNAVRWAFVRANPLPTDVDSDDLPDTWEADQLGSIAVSAGGTDNYDNDPDSDVFEYLAGTQSGNPASYFDPALTDYGGGTIEVTFDAITNRIYVLETTEVMSTNSTWTIRALAIPPTNSIKTLRYTVPGNPPKLFGRVGIVEPD